MPTTTLTSREFNRDSGRAKNAAKSGPVFITDRGQSAHVLLTIEEYQRITGSGAKISDLLALPGAAEVALEIPQHDERARPAEFD